MNNNVKLIILIFCALTFFAAEAQPQSDQGFLHITSTPPGAKIYIDGIFHSEADDPIEISLPGGEHRITAAIENYITQTKTVYLEKNLVVRLNFNLSAEPTWTERATTDDVLDKAVGNLSIITNPSGAKIVIDQKQLNNTSPISIEGIGAGTHKVVVSLFDPSYGLLKSEESIEIEEGETYLHNVDLSAIRKYGNIHISSDSTLLSVGVKSHDGRVDKIFNNVGNDGIIAENLFPGKYNINVRAPGFESYNYEIEVKRDFTTVSKPYLKLTDRNLLTLDDIGLKLVAEERQVFHWKFFGATAVSWAAFIYGFKTFSDWKAANPSYTSDSDPDDFDDYPGHAWGLRFVGGWSAFFTTAIVAMQWEYDPKSVFKKNIPDPEKIELNESYQRILRERNEPIKKQNVEISQYNKNKPHHTTIYRSN